MDDTDATATTTFFFAAYGKSFVPTFNCSIRNMSKVERLTYSFIYVFKHPSSSVGRDFINGALTMGGSSKGEGGGTSYDVAP
jgi:hypothetical protein